MNASLREWPVIKWTALWLSGWIAVAANVCARPLPTELTSALLLKAVELETRLGAKDALTILVLGNRELFSALRARRRDVIGTGNLQEILRDELPTKAKPDVIFIGRHTDLTAILEYAQRHQILTVSDNIALASRGVAMILYDDDGLPGILLNITVSKQRGLVWKPEILEFVEPIY
jgi:hypothetical protein